MDSDPIHDVILDDSLSFSSANSLKRKYIEETIDYQTITAETSSLDQNHQGLSVQARKLACPFLRKDCHNAALSRTCRRSDWDSVARVKEHISRCHAPKNQCHRCRRDFNNANELAKHQRNINACPLILDAPLSQFITADQIVQLKRRAGKRANISSEDKWCSVYKILFPGDSFVPSPYRDEPCVACISKASSQLLENYRQHQVQALVPLVERELAAISHSHGMSDGLRAHITDLFSRLSVKVLNEFQEKHASNIPENYTFPSGCEMEPRNSTCEAATSPPSAITLAFSQLQDFLGYDAVPDMMLNGYDLMEEKLE
ncbi:hypothetical protein F5B22DRAFT_101947 [Xylaria bambusicola]|uniref:uncharacterized protein n=1 Tax=Xylaria bambusicola TaxID=326684 RepID=UPI00200852DB|nr:uncharacterized protein F5B22DRAFT_101947 [Xylaria bambusicola]KAI0517842.1 hypothetical protein F5B22DRAFT_101947 [Xylaria bambusicola]